MSSRPASRGESPLSPTESPSPVWLPVESGSLYGIPLPAVKIGPYPALQSLHHYYDRFHHPHTYSMARWSEKGCGVVDLYEGSVEELDRGAKALHEFVLQQFPIQPAFGGKQEATTLPARSYAMCVAEALIQCYTEADESSRCIEREKQRSLLKWTQSIAQGFFSNFSPQKEVATTYSQVELVRTVKLYLASYTLEEFRRDFGRDWIMKPSLQQEADIDSQCIFLEEDRRHCLSEKMITTHFLKPLESDLSSPLFPC